VERPINRGGGGGDGGGGNQRRPLKKPKSKLTDATAEKKVSSLGYTWPKGSIHAGKKKRKEQVLGGFGGEVIKSQNGRKKKKKKKADKIRSWKRGTGLRGRELRSVQRSPRSIW